VRLGQRQNVTSIGTQIGVDHDGSSVSGESTVSPAMSPIHSNATPAAPPPARAARRGAPPQ
jgi:hypothetical protein